MREELFNEMVRASAPLSIELLEYLDHRTEKTPDATQCLALLGAAIALAKTSGFVDQFALLNAAAAMWHAQEAKFTEATVQ